MAENQQQDQQQQGASSSNRGFAAMDEDKQREIASKGGSSVDPEDRSFSKDHELAAEAGRKGGQASQGDGGASATREGDDSDGSGRGGNFADDPERASEAGRKGGER
ncbi:general stress protein [Brevundimonas diminuta ATCC 11568]|uniref:general stress protein n=1 Tax=Brevundimonas diminuta TaxID=293 RepID=UPI0039C85598